jgi:hypothetical protein
MRAHQRRVEFPRDCSSARNAFISPAQSRRFRQALGFSNGKSSAATASKHQEAVSVGKAALALITALQKMRSRRYS